MNGASAPQAGTPRRAAAAAGRPDSKSASPASTWARYHPTAEAPWDLQRVVHLYRRAGFGATWQELQQALGDGPQITLDRLLSGRIDGRSPQGFEPTSQMLAEAAVAVRHPVRLKAAWVYRMIHSPDPLGEQLVLMWHNHFATSNLKVNDPGLMWRQNETFRRLARAPFGEMLQAMLRDPALLIWLDAPANRAAAPNENLARELLELFTLGATRRQPDAVAPQHAGTASPRDAKQTADLFGRPCQNFTERDVKETARALTGWSVKDGLFCELPQEHDGGVKTILGQTGRWQANDLAAILLDTCATARRIAWRICDHFLGERVAREAEIDALASGLGARSSRKELDVDWAVQTVLRSEKFFDKTTVNSRIVPPVDYVVAAVRALEPAGRGPSSAILADWIAELGQDLFYPPNVGGWPGGRSWLSPRTLVGRTRFATELASGRLGRPTRPVDVQALARRNGFGTSKAATLEFLSRLLLGSPLPPEWSKLLADDLSDSPAHSRFLLSRLLSSPLAQLG